MAKRFRANKSWRGYVEIIGNPKDLMNYLDLYIDLLKSIDKFIPLTFRISKDLKDEYGEWIDNVDDLLQYLKKEGLLKNE